MSEQLLTAEQARVILWDRFVREPTLGEVIELVEDGEAPSESLPASVERREQRHRSRRWVAAHAPRACRECGAMFTPTDARQVFCSPAHRKRYAYLQPKRDAKHKDELTYVGRQPTSRESNDGGGLLVTKRGSPTLECPRCGETFAPRRTDQQFCSGACRQAAYRERKETAA